MLYQILAGQFPYPTDGPLPQVAQHILKTVPKPPSQITQVKANTSDSGLDAIVLKALSKPADLRHSSAGGLGLELDEWLRRRLRMCQWKAWKRIRTRVRQLRALGLKELDVWEAAGSRKSYWRTAGAPPLQKALSNAYWQAQGLMTLADRYQAVRKAW
jgi:serine/threonine protein kinase